MPGKVSIIQGGNISNFNPVGTWTGIVEDWEFPPAPIINNEPCYTYLADKYKAKLIIHANGTYTYEINTDRIIHYDCSKNYFYIDVTTGTGLYTIKDNELHIQPKVRSTTAEIRLIDYPDILSMPPYEKEASTQCTWEGFDRISILGNNVMCGTTADCGSRGIVIWRRQ